MRILVVTYEFPPVGGGGGHAARDICLELSKRNYDVRVITSYYKGLPRQEDLQGIRVVRVPAARRELYRADLLTMASFVLSGLARGFREVSSWQPDIIHVHFAVPSGPVAWILSKLSKIPYVLTAHLGDVPGGVPEKTDKWFRWIFPFTPPIWKDAAHVAAVSENTRFLALKHYSVQAQIIHNGAEINYLEPGKIRVHSPPRIVFAGRFMPQKNPVQLVRTLGAIKHLAWECNMIGDGPMRPDVENEIQAQNLVGRIHLSGWLDPEQVIGYLSESDILFLPSFSEGLPVVGVQSLAKGLSIVSSDILGMRDLVTPGENGYLVNPMQPVGFETALTELLTHPGRLLAFREQSYSRSCTFDIQRIVSAYEEIFAQVIQRKKEKSLKSRNVN